MAAENARTVVLTGATRGIGRAMVDELVRLGHVVHGCGRSKRDVDALASMHGAPHSFGVVDVSSDEAVLAWAKAVLARGAVPDLVLNNAALINKNAPLWQVPVAEFDALVDVNIKGVANVIRHFAPAMIARRSGVIVNFSSGWGRSTDAEVAPYCATKWAIEGLSRALAQELPAGMACVPFSPGVVDTDMLRSCFGGEAGHSVKPAEWARKCVPYLLKISARDNGKPLTAP